MKRRKKKTTFGDVVIVSGILALLGMAIREQLQLPPEQRTWHGTFAGIPYDFRIPTIDKLWATFWNKDTSRILVPHAFGMGWSINFYPLVHPMEVQERS
jgi:hypothetical protein